MSGIGCFMYQNWDFIARNPIYRDLCDYEWPIVYDLSQQSDAVKAITGSDTVAFSYYLTYWLPPALLSKIFVLNELGRNVILYFYTVLGVFLITYNLCRYFKKTSYIILAIFIFFSGMDIVGYLLRYVFAITAKINPSGEVTELSKIIYIHIERWCKFLYLSNTTQLFNVFNQAVPVWLIAILFLQLRSNKNSLALSSLTFAYSAWAIFGMIPLALWQAFKLNKKFRDAFTLQNILIPLAILITYGSFYIMGNGSHGKPFQFYIENFKELCEYMLFTLLEFGIYMIIMGKRIAKYDFYHIVLIELLLFPLYTLDINLIMRGTLSTLFVFMIFILRFLFEEDRALKKRKIILVIALVIGAVTSVNEINRSVLYSAVHVLRENNLLPTALIQWAENENIKFSRNEINSLGKIKTEDKMSIEMCKDQFFAYDYKNSFFFKYLAKD